MVEEADNGGIADLDAQFLPEIAVEPHAGPVLASCSLGMIEHLPARLDGDLARPTRFGLVEQAVDTRPIEGSDPASQGSRRHAEEVCHGGGFEAHDQGNHGPHTPGLALAAGTAGRGLQLGMGGVLGVGRGRTTRHTLLDQ